VNLNQEFPSKKQAWAAPQTMLGFGFNRNITNFQMEADKTIGLPQIRFTVLFSADICAWAARNGQPNFLIHIQPPNFHPDHLSLLHMGKSLAEAVSRM
jgi:hypothetical protein